VTDQRVTPLTIYHLQYTLQATEPLELEQHPGSALRGALFTALWERFCVNKEAQECAPCPLVQTCPVSALVAPLRDAHPRGRDIPRPFVVRPPLLAAGTPEGERMRWEPGQAFTLGLTLVGSAGKLFPYVVLAARVMEGNGLGRALRENRGRRGRFAIERIEAVQPFTGVQATLFERGEVRVRAPEVAIGAADVAKRAAALPETQVALRFLTPTRLTEAGQLVHGPQPAVLLRRLAERVDALEEVYGGQEGGFLAAAGEVGQPAHVPGRWYTVAASADLQMAQQEVRWIDTRSYSSRQRRTLPIGGFIGTACYVGTLSQVLRELLVWGELLNVGKNTVKGDGWYQIEA
jgi:hypothetical protein